MINAAPAQTKRTRSKPEQPLAWKFEIIDEDSVREPSPWADLRRNLGALVEKGRDALGDMYVAVAQAVVERKENLDDRRAERKALRQIAAKTANSAPPKARSVEIEAEPRKLSAPTSRSDG
jgi:hypothetical protein